MKKKIEQKRDNNIGTVKLFFRFCFEVFLQANNGPTPVKKRRNKPIGIVTWLKKGAPTVILVPWTASVITGNIVPQNTAKQSVTKITLLKRNPLSLEVKDSIRFSDFRFEKFLIIR